MIVPHFPYSSFFPADYDDSSVIVNQHFCPVMEIYVILNDTHPQLAQCQDCTMPGLYKCSAIQGLPVQISVDP